MARACGLETGDDCWCEPVVVWSGTDVAGNEACVRVCRRGIWESGEPPAAVIADAIVQAMMDTEDD